MIAHRRHRDPARLVARAAQRLPIKKLFAQLLQLAARDALGSRRLLCPRWLGVLGTTSCAIPDQHATPRVSARTRGSRWHSRVPYEWVPVACPAFPHCGATACCWPFHRQDQPAHQPKSKPRTVVVACAGFSPRGGGWWTPIPRCPECIASLYGVKLLSAASAWARALCLASRSACSQASIHRSACSSCAWMVLTARRMRRAVSFTPRSFR